MGSDGVHPPDRRERRSRPEPRPCAGLSGALRPLLLGRVGVGERDFHPCKGAEGRGSGLVGGRGDGGSLETCMTLNGDGVVFTLFSSDKDPQGTRFSGLNDLLDSLKDPAPRSTEKTALPMWSLATFEDDYRSGETSLCVTGFVFDVDADPVPSIELIREGMEGLAGFVTSSSSATADAPRWRLVIWTDKPVLSMDYKRLGVFVADSLPFPVARNSIEPARAWYASREPESGSFVMEVFDGEPLEVGWLLKEAPVLPESDSRVVVVAPPELPYEEMQRRCDLFVKYLKETRDNGMRVAAEARIYELPMAVAAAEIENHYAPRVLKAGNKVWSKENIQHKLSQAYAGTIYSDLVFGSSAKRVCPVGFFERLMGRVQTKEQKSDGRTSEDNCARPTGETAKISLANLVADLRYHKDWHGVLSYDDLRKWVVCERAPIKLDAEQGNVTEADYTRIRMWLERHGKIATKDAVIDAVNVVALENKFNPVLDYLNALPPSDGSALNDLAKKALGNDSDLVREAIVKTLVAAVRRIRRPGTKVDTVLVLRGNQGLRKSSFLTTLFGEEYVKSQMPDLASKDASVGLRGMWAVELAEMDRVIRAESSTVKEFITRAIDSYRPPYGHTEEQFPRQCIFIGTTNDMRFLVDETGNRRYWIVEVNKYDLKWLAKHKDEIWSAANALEAKGVPHWYEDETKTLELQQPYEFVDEWEAPIREYLTGRKTVSSAAEIYTEVISRGDPNALAKLDRRVQNRVMNILTCRLKCVVKRVHGKYWIEIPTEISSETPSPEETSRREATAKMHELKKLSVN